MICVLPVISIICGKRVVVFFCHTIEEVDDDDSDYKSDYDHGDDWDPEELLVDSEEDNDDDNNNNMEEDADGYTAIERAYMDAISILEDDVDMVEEEQEEEEEEKDERYYLREEKALENVAVINKLRLHINK